MKAPSLAGKAMKNQFAPIVLLTLVYLSVGFLTRIVLILSTDSSNLSFGDIGGLFSIGAFYDLLIALTVLSPMVLHIWFTNERIYRSKWSIAVISIAVAVIMILVFTQLVPEDFNEDIRKASIIYPIVRLGIFLLLLFAGPAFRLKWRKAVLTFDVLLFVFLMLFNAVSEFFFWQEFSSRYNFIAVDYLVYTTEVLGNIRESYPITLIIGSVLFLSALLVLLFRKPILYSPKYSYPFGQRSIIALTLLILPAAGLFFVTSEQKKFSKNNYANELAGNGVFEFVAAFANNELDFYRYYQVLNDQKAFELVRKDLQDSCTKFVSNDPFSIEREISYPGPEEKKNVVMISIESFSASFMKPFGNDKNLTPFLDSLANKSMLFSNLYASGTRTVRGLEALSLSIPPTPGQSVVKRPGNANMFTLGHVLKTQGYSAQYIYGGYSYFDNMKGFFSNNEYEVIDREAIPANKTHFANIWGVCDEDLFTLALDKIDQESQAGKHFFTQVMTVSNHRPFTYPEGRIDISPTTQTREGAVKYTDYAIGKFIREASSRPWFKNTIFVIVADHCAGSAGSVELPVTGYHIPLLVYSPGFIQPKKIDKLMAQIDIIPTVLGLMKMDYRSKFLGRDIFNVAKGNEHAYISTYQGLGFLNNEKLVIQSPKHQVKTFLPDFKTGEAVEVQPDSELTEKAIAYYQVASWLLKNNKQLRDTTVPGQNLKAAALK